VRMLCSCGIGEAILLIESAIEIMDMEEDEDMNEGLHSKGFMPFMLSDNPTTECRVCLGGVESPPFPNHQPLPFLVPCKLVLQSTCCVLPTDLMTRRRFSPAGLGFEPPFVGLQP